MCKKVSSERLATVGTQMYKQSAMLAGYFFAQKKAQMYKQMGIVGQTTRCVKAACANLHYILCAVRNERKR